MTRNSGVIPLEYRQKNATSCLITFCMKSENNSGLNSCLMKAKFKEGKFNIRAGDHVFE